MAVLYAAVACLVDVTIDCRVTEGRSRDESCSSKYDCGIAHCHDDHRDRHRVTNPQTTELQIKSSLSQRTTRVSNKFAASFAAAVQGNTRAMIQKPCLGAAICLGVWPSPHLTPSSGGHDEQQADPGKTLAKLRSSRSLLFRA